MITTIKQILNDNGYLDNRNWTATLNCGILRNSSKGILFKKNGEETFNEIKDYPWETIADLYNDVRQQLT